MQNLTMEEKERGERLLQAEIKKLAIISQLTHRSMQHANLSF